MSKSKPTLQKFIRAWRSYRGLSQEQVGNIMNVAHTTVGRWERGEVPLTSDQFEKLAAIFEASPAQLLADPSDSEMVATLQATHDIVRNMDANTLRHWLEIGKKLTS